MGWFRFGPTGEPAASRVRLRVLEATHREAPLIKVWCDDARYDQGRAAGDYLAASRMRVVFRPPQSPHLNRTDLVRKFFKKRLADDRPYDRWRTSRV